MTKDIHFPRAYFFELVIRSIHMVFINNVFSLIHRDAFIYSTLLDAT
jgi:hypothetical protein